MSSLCHSSIRTGSFGSQLEVNQLTSRASIHNLCSRARAEGVGRWRSRFISTTTPRRRPIRVSWKSCGDSHSSILETRAVSTFTAERRGLQWKRLGRRSRTCYSLDPRRSCSRAGPPRATIWSCWVWPAMAGASVERTSWRHRSSTLPSLARSRCSVAKVSISSFCPLVTDGYVDPAEVRARLRSDTSARLDHARE